MFGFPLFLVTVFAIAFAAIGIWLLIWRKGRTRRIIRRAKKHPAGSVTDMRHRGIF